MDIPVALVIAYALGSVDFGVIVPRAMGVDIYEEGSGNPGTSNVFRTLGKRAAALVLVGDLIKGLLAVAVASAIAGEGATAHAAGLAAVLGHVYPVWHGFKGGRGVATAIGASIWLQPWFGVVVGVAWAAVVVVTKTASVASLVAMAVLVPGFAVIGARGWSLLWVAAMALIVVVRHADNISRLLRRQERTVTET